MISELLFLVSIVDAPVVSQGVSATSRHSLPTSAVWDDAKLHVCAVLPVSGFSRWVFGPLASKEIPTRVGSVYGYYRRQTCLKQ